jgi:regulator of sigma E protease
VPYLVTALIVSLLIAIHELGHLLAAKLCGIPIARFSVGFGPPLVSVRWGATSYCLSAIPLGGYVLPALDERASDELPIHKAIVFALGGPVANRVAAYLGLVVLGLLQPGLSWLEAPSFVAAQLWTQLQLLGQAVPSLLAGSGELVGIVGIVALGGSRFGSTLAGALTFSVAINLNLAVLNLLPLPPLDGGRIALATLARFWRPVLRVQTAVTLAGWACVLGLMAYATYRDLGRLGASLFS